MKNSLTVKIKEIWDRILNGPNPRKNFLLTGHQNARKGQKKLEQMGITYDEIADVLVHGCDPYNENPTDEIIMPTKTGSQIILTRIKTIRGIRKK